MSIRVLLISHTCQSKTEGQPKALCLSKLPNIDLHVLTPDRWMHYGKWRSADVVDPDHFRCTIGEVRWPWIGPAQFYLHWYPKLSGILRDFRPDVIDLWEEPWGLVSAHACMLRDRLLPSAAVVSETEQNINKQLPLPFEQFRRYTLSRADYAVGRNKESLEVLRSKGYNGPAQTVPNAVDAELFRPMDRATCRTRLGLKGFVAGYVGRLVEEKGLLDMVAALPFCPHDVNLLFVGSGNCQESIVSLAQSIGVSERVKVLPGRALGELPEIMNAIDVLALPSRTTASWKEQFGRVIIEAHACGTPVAGSDSGAIPEVIGEAGMVFRERNPEHLAETLNKMYNDPEGCRRMGELGRTAVDQKYTWQRVAESMSEVYVRAIESHNSR